MKKQTAFKLLVFLLVAVFIIPASALAADLEITCPSTSGRCAVSGIEPLFSQVRDGLWYPGKVVTKSLLLKNLSSEKKVMGLGIKQVRSSNSALQNDLQIAIFPPGGGPVLFSDNLSRFYQQERILLGLFQPGESRQFVLQISMNQDSGNETQNKQSSFDLQFGFWSGEVKGQQATEPISAQTPTLNPLVSFLSALLSLIRDFLIGIFRLMF